MCISSRPRNYVFGAFGHLLTASKKDHADGECLFTHRLNFAYSSQHYNRMHPRQLLHRPGDQADLDQIQRAQFPHAAT